MGIQIKLEMTKDKAAKYNGKWVQARDNGMFTSLKTKLKNTDTLLLYDGVTKTKAFPMTRTSKSLSLSMAMTTSSKFPKSQRARKQSTPTGHLKSSTISWFSHRAAMARVVPAFLTVSKKF